MNSPDLRSLGWSDWFASHASSHPSHLLPARVSAEHRGRVDLLGAFGLRHALTHGLEPPRVGDWLLVEPVAGSDLVRIRALLPRRSWLERQAAGRRTERQIVATNLDRVFVLTSLNQDFSLARAERYLASVRAGHIEPVLVLSKADLAPDKVHRHLSELERVAGGAPVIAASVLYREGLDDLRALLGPGITVGLVGSSGVGKSTLVNALLGVDQQDTRAVRQGDDQGQHRTTTRSLHLLPDGQGILVDTPGMRELALWSGDGLGETFEDIDLLAARCRYRDCQHQGEPGCAVEEAILEGELDARRLESHRKLQREAAWQEARVSVAEQRRAAREFAHRVRSAKKDRW